MKTVTNKTNAPIKVPLPRNKSLRLGPGNVGQMNDADSERPAVVKMVEAGQIEVFDAGADAGNSGGADLAVILLINITFMKIY